MPGLTALPEETLVHILARAPPLGILRCREVCRFICRLIDSSTELQYLITLYSFGYVPPSDPRLDLSYSEKVALLKSLEEQWATNISPKKKKYPLRRTPTGGSSTYDFYGGVYARGSPFVQGGPTRCLDLYQLPSANKGTKWKQWSHPDLGVDVRDFAMEPDYDLLVMAEMKDNVHNPSTSPDAPNSTQYFTIHIRSLETNQPHPGAARPQISYSCPSWGTASCSFYFQVVGRYLAIVFLIGGGFVLSHTFHLVVWDWTTGKKITYTEPSRDGPESFTFISDRMFVLPSPGTRAENSFARGRGRLDIYTFTEPIGDSPAQPARRIASLAFPELEEGGNIYRITCRSDPAPAPSSQTATRHRGYPKVFQLSPDNRVLCLAIHAFNPNEGQPHLIRGGMLYIPFSVLLGAAAYLVNEPVSDDPVEIPWEDWGKETSWMDTSRTFMGNECYVYGQRVVMVGIGDVESSDEDADANLEVSRSLIVLDFDPVRTKRLPSYDMPAFQATNATSLPDVLGLPMEKDVLGTAFLGGEHKADMKFIVRRTDMEDDVHGTYYVMVDDEHVVLVQYNRRGQESSLLVYSFN